MLELIGILLPRALGWTIQIDAGLARTLFSVTLHAIVYFWLMPAYIAFYTLVPQAAGGRLYSDTMGRLTFIMFLVFSLPVGHPPSSSPIRSIGAGFKFLQSFLTFLVALPTLLTVFSICASLEIAGRASWRPRAPGLDRGTALGGADGAGGRIVAGDARPRRVRRAHQYELRHELDDPQHVLGARRISI